jgi:hypothetical protein
MNKQYSQYREVYDQLSEIVHPNGMGAVVYFTNITPEDTCVIYDDGHTPQRALVSLICAGFLLNFAEIAIAGIEPKLQKLSAEA